jgi:hypothetical protein
MIIQNTDKPLPSTFRFDTSESTNRELQPPTHSNPLKGIQIIFIDKFHSQLTLYPLSLAKTEGSFRALTASPWLEPSKSQQIINTFDLHLQKIHNLSEQK